MPQLDGLTEELEGIEEERTEIKEAVEVPKKRKYIFFPSKNDLPLVYDASTAELAETDRVKADEDKTAADFEKDRDGKKEVEEDDLQDLATAPEVEMDRKENQDPEENQDPAIKIDIHEIEKNMEKWKKKVEDITESEIEDINIFRYHPHFAKSISITDITEHTDQSVAVDRNAVSGDDTDLETPSSRDRWTEVRYKR